MASGVSGFDRTQPKGRVMKSATTLIHNTACPRNVFLNYRVEDFLKANGWSLVGSKQFERSDLIVFFPCATRKIEVKKGIDFIRSINWHIAQLPNSPQFVICGCIPPIDPDALAVVHSCESPGTRRHPVCSSQRTLLYSHSPCRFACRGPLVFRVAVHLN